MQRHAAIRAIVVGGFIAGTLDMLFAISFSAWYGVPAMRVLQSVASGVMGKAAYSGGAPVAALGLALHLGMACAFAGAFFLASRRVAFLVRRPVLSGAMFGVMVYLVMWFVVLPLSAFPHPIRFKPVATILELMSHMFLFGVPIALAASRAQDPSTYWFPAKQQGWGWGLPTVWQGWVVMAIFAVALVAGAMVLLPVHGSAAFVSLAALLCVLLVAICWITGEPPAWRRGGK
jgi:hypothetical protein